jgi:hypothetical protein
MAKKKDDVTIPKDNSVKETYNSIISELYGIQDLLPEDDELSNIIYDKLSSVLSSVQSLQFLSLP